MCYYSGMSDIERLKLLTHQMHLEPAEDCQADPLPAGGQEAITVKNAQMPNGKSIRLLKTLLSSYCENNCVYCPFRAQRDMPRAAFTPDDFAKLFISLYRRGFVEGIFLSSSIFHGAIRSQDLLLDTAWILRHRYQFQGYLHLKIMPGVEQAQVEQAMLLADRLSINLEAPHARALSILAPRKHFQEDLINPLLWIEKIRQEKASHCAWNGRWPSSTTQFVVGAAGETDQDILLTTESLSRDAGISRAYFSSFKPIIDTPLENIEPSPLLREFRLYQAFFLLRDYGFTGEDLVFSSSGNLPLEQDPKLAWAEHNLLHDPIEINTAPKTRLLRIPGIGPKRADQIILLRDNHPINSISALQKMNLISPKSSPYLLVNGKSPAKQLNFF
jgi:predicted DNA-binding helix-hairpin-helix protein